MSAAPKFTPGPWRARQATRVLGCDARGQFYVHGKDVTIAAMLGGEQEANARLLAAAPDMYEALESAERELNIAAQRDPQAVIALGRVRAALATARGKS